MSLNALTGNDGVCPVWSKQSLSLKQSLAGDELARRENPRCNVIKFRRNDNGSKPASARIETVGDDRNAPVHNRIP